MQGRKSIKNMQLVPAGLGAGIALLFSIAMVWIMSGLLVNERVGDAFAQKTLFGIMVLSSFVAGMTANMIVKTKVWYICPISCALYLTVMIVLGVAVFEGKFEGLWFGAAMITVGATMAGFASGKKRGNKRKYKIHSR